jgi:hypothetical protein
MALPVWLALVPTHALAVDATGGNDTNVNQLVNTVGPAAWVTLRAQQIAVPANTRRHCVATGSSDALNPGGVANNFYRFTLSLNAGFDPIDTGRERTLQFFNQPIGGLVVTDSRIKEITSTWFFSLPPSPQSVVYFIRWRATKFAAATANMTVDDSSLSVVCTDATLSPILVPVPLSEPLLEPLPN